METAQGSSGSGCTSDDLQDCSWRACCGLLEVIWAWDLSRGEQCLVDYAGNRDGVLRERSICGSPLRVPHPTDRAVLIKGKADPARRPPPRSTKLPGKGNRHRVLAATSGMDLVSFDAPFVYAPSVLALATRITSSTHTLAQAAAAALTAAASSLPPGLRT